LCELVKVGLGCSSASYADFSFGALTLGGFFSLPLIRQSSRNRRQGGESEGTTERDFLEHIMGLGFGSHRPPSLNFA
jgi:hypothetical protein